MIDFGLSEKTAEILKGYFSQIPKISMVKIYGSRAMGNYRKGSDIDFALYGNIDKEVVKKIGFELDELNTPYMFDVTDYATIQNEKLKEHIDNYGKIFFVKMG
ncbi:MAG: nucleotidyltransferase domain-containing protein [Candidatus Gastranaerophilaceae bacterium]